MELILAVVVVTAVIFFGVLISAGNERQRKAIDDLREQTALWAMQDLRIKREKLAREVHVDDPLGWLNAIATKVCGYDMNLQVVEALDQPRALFCESGNDGGKVFLSPLSPGDFRRLSHGKQNRLSQYEERNRLLHSLKSAMAYEASVLNCSLLFDLELPIAWRGVTGQDLGLMDRLWIYIVR